MGQSYRIRTELGTDKAINLELNQDFEFLEILSLKIQQADVYTRACSDYGVVVGRVTANNGTGIPNAKISIFIPASEQDLLDEEIRSIYPYSSPTDVNEDGFRYNLLPYEKSYSKHAATGTFPSRLDVLTNSTAAEIYDKFYKFTVKTNQSGDYMIMGVPLGLQRVIMDVDLSDIGEFSLTPQDLIRIGRATASQVSGNRFRSSNDLNSLPQIITLSKTVEILPLWGEPEICQISINRVDFDLRDEANIDIQPTSVFMGSIFSNNEKYRIRKNCRPRDNTGELCSLESGPGQIFAIRQTIFQDSDGNPTIEQYQLENSGNIIDQDGTWLTELPMNLDYVVTNEFGERIISADPNIGIPTKAKYRFKINWQQPKDLTQQTRRASFLVPNVREYGWTTTSDPYLTAAKTSNQYKQLSSSYYFGLDWSGYTNGFGAFEDDKADLLSNCEDAFYQFSFNKVYTVSGLIDQYKKGNRARFIGIKEIDDDDCLDSVNKFPANEGYRNYDTLFFVFAILFTIIQYIGSFLLFFAHIIVGVIYQIIRLLSFGAVSGGIPIRLPMITYPECQSCDCKPAEAVNTLIDTTGRGVLSTVSLPQNYYQNFVEYLYSINYQPAEDIQIIADLFSQSMGGNISAGVDTVYKVPKSNIEREVSEGNDKMFVWSMDLPIGERINIFNQRSSYFTGSNRIKVSFDANNNAGNFHYDNTLTVLANREFLPGQLLTSVNPATTSDKNFRFTEIISGETFFGITGTSNSSPQQIVVNYADTNSQSVNRSTTYNLTSGSTIQRQIFPMDREYYQVITALTVSQYVNLVAANPSQSFPDVINSATVLRFMEKATIDYRERSIGTGNVYKFSDFYENFGEQYVLILQRGVDPYSPRFINKFNLGLLFGSNIDDSRFIVNTSARVNVPIQTRFNGYTVQDFSTQSQIFYGSQFFTPGGQYSAFTSSSVGYYAALDASYVPTIQNLSYQSFNGRTGAVGDGDFYNSSPNTGKYDLSEDLSGNAFINGKVNRASWTSFLGGLIPGIIDSISLGYNEISYIYNSPNLYPELVNNPLSITFPTMNVMRTDRLPSSDSLDGLAWDKNNVAVLQQNINFTFYEISEPGDTSLTQQFATEAEDIGQDIEDQIYDGEVLSSFNCENMVSLGCYTGFSNTFGINTRCAETDAVVNGCYVLFTNPLLGLIRDLRYFSEWGTRYKFFYGICRGILSQSFTNNWVNGTLFAFPIEVSTTYNSQNKPNEPQFCKDVVFFDENTNNFYYRSSPYDINSNRFVGKLATETTAINFKNLLFPTTILDLGYKDSFYSELVLDPATNAYIVENLNPTSYSDPSDIINLFVISRILSASYLQGDAINKLFSRNTLQRNKRVDADLAQMLSINSEEGVIKFSPEFYSSNTTNSPVGIYGNPNNPTIGIFFSSTTDNLQFKDYVTPGRIDFRGSPTANFTPYTFGIKSQLVPFYPWRLQNTINIFGTEQNNWSTSQTDIVQYYYQSLDRTAIQYFKGSGIVNDQNMRGYIFNVLNDTVNVAGRDYKASGPIANSTSSFVVGAPFHFYFGTVVGASAIDKFKTKYLANE